MSRADGAGPFPMCRSLMGCVLLAAGMHTAALAQAPERAALTARLDSIAREGQSRWRLVGISVAVLRGRYTLLDRGYGHADLSLRAPATASTTYRVIGPALAAAVMQQVERGTLRL